MEKKAVTEATTKRLREGHREELNRGNGSENSCGSGKVRVRDCGTDGACWRGREMNAEDRINSGGRCWIIQVQK
jgi:hypothetical protein